MYLIGLTKPGMAKPVEFGKNSLKWGMISDRAPACQLKLDTQTNRTEMSIIEDCGGEDCRGPPIHPSALPPSSSGSILVSWPTPAMWIRPSIPRDLDRSRYQVDIIHLKKRTRAVDWELGVCDFFLLPPTGCDCLWFAFWSRHWRQKSTQSDAVGGYLTGLANPGISTVARASRCLIDNIPSVRRKNLAP